MTATLVDLNRPLPALWDGRAVTWDPWSLLPPIFMCDRTKRKNGLTIPGCDACGTTGAQLHAVGMRAPAPGATEPGEYLRTHRNGAPVLAMEPARAYRDLHATRCPACGQDHVYDLESHESWDLDETDYGPEGSTAP